MPFPHLWNYRKPLRILDAVFWGADKEESDAKHNRYAKVPSMGLALITRDPSIIKAVLLDSGAKPGQFDRDTWPTSGIARATGAQTMLYLNRTAWRNHKRLAARPFAASALFQPEIFGEFERTFRKTVGERLDAFGARHRSVHPDGLEIALEPEISALMLEMLVNNFFGGQVSYEEVRTRFVPSLEKLIKNMVRETVNPLSRGGSETKRWKADFEALVDHALEGRKTGQGAWKKFNVDVPDEDLRPNLRVFLAGALEATTSLAAWTISHLAHRPDLQAAIHDEVSELDVYNPDNLEKCPMLNAAIQETLRLTPALYFLPRLATADTVVTAGESRTLKIPKGTHVVLDVWHANRCEEFWGVDKTGHPAIEFEPARWQFIKEEGLTNEALHFGFGHGARVCPGKFLGMLEVGLLVGGMVKLFRFWSTKPPAEAVAGVSTKPADATTIWVKRR
ncbi:MAG: cytochrome P450 [Thermoplasmatota archaeon]